MTGGFGEVDLWLARAGRHEQIYEKLGAHVVDGGVRFAVWAPNAALGQRRRRLQRLGRRPRARCSSSATPASGRALVDGAEEGHRYKFHVDGRDKADPYAFRAEVPPQNASIVFESRHVWQDAAWLEARRAQDPLERPVSMYEVHAVVVAAGPRLARARRGARPVRRATWGSRMSS